MKTIVFLLLIVISSCDNKRTDLKLYIENPDKKDSLCISDINRAQKDISNGKIVFTEGFSLGSSSLRYESELKELCKTYGVVFDYEPISCMIYRGQTQGCYKLYMDKILTEKYGLNFKEKLHRKADSLLFINAKENDKVIISWNCDKKPKLINQTKPNEEFTTTIKVKNLNIIEDKSEYGGFPFLDISFIIEKDSTISNFTISNFVPKIEENEKLKSSLFEIAVQYLSKNHPISIPGEIKETPVRTENNVRIFFEKKNH